MRVHVEDLAARVRLRVTLRFSVTLSLTERG